MGKRESRTTGRTAFGRVALGRTAEAVNPVGHGAAAEGATGPAPRLSITRPEASGEPRAERTVTTGEGAGVQPADRERFLDLVLGADDAAPAAYVDALVRCGVPVDDVYMRLLAPTAEALGRMWSDDACDFVDVTLATGRLQRAVRELGHGFVGAAPVGRAAGRVLLSAMPREQHTLGLFIVAEYLLRDGWHVRVLTPDASADLAAALRDGWYDVVGFSAACDSRLLAMRHEIAAVRRHSRNPQVSVVVGGRIFVEHPELVARVGADGSASTAADAPACARACLAAPVGGAVG